MTHPTRHVSYWLAVTSAVLLVGGLVLIAVYAFATQGSHLRYLGAGLLTAIAAFAAGCLFGFLFGIPRLVSSGDWRRAHTPDAATQRVNVPATPPSNTTPAASGGPEDQATGQTQPGPEAPPPPPDPPANPQQTALGTGTGTSTTPLLDDTKFFPSSNLAEISDWLTKLLLGAGLVQLTRMGPTLRAIIDAAAMGLTDPGSPPDGPARLIAAATLLAYSVLGFLDSYVITNLWYGRRLAAATS